MTKQIDITSKNEMGSFHFTSIVVDYDHSSITFYFDSESSGNFLLDYSNCACTISGKNLNRGAMGVTPCPKSGKDKIFTANDGALGFYGADMSNITSADLTYTIAGHAPVSLTIAIPVA